MLGGRHAEPNRQWNIGVGPDARQIGAKIRQCRSLTGDTDQRDAVDEAAGALGDGRDARIGRGGRQEEDQVEPMPATDGQLLIALFGGEIRHDVAVDAGGCAVPG